MYCFCYGSNSLKQLNDRLIPSYKLHAEPAYLNNWCRIFVGNVPKWNGAVASILPKKNKRVYGSVVKLSASQFQKLDRYENTNINDPYSYNGYYRRQLVILNVYISNKFYQCPAIAYIANNQHPTELPSLNYMMACYINISQVFNTPYIIIRDSKGHIMGKWSIKGGETESHVIKE